MEEAIQELKENEFKEVFEEDLKKDPQYVRDVQVDTDVEMLIPDDYISNIQERLSLYTELDKIESEEKVIEFEKKLRDRFGPVPKEVKSLFDGLKLRWISKRLGFERIILKNRKLRCYFVENPQSLYYESPIFKAVMTFVSTQGHKTGFGIKQSSRHLILVKDGVKSMKAAETLLEDLENSLEGD